MNTVIQSPAKKAATKTSTVCKLLARPRGATVSEIMAATKWQNHSVRAFFTGLRKKGRTLVREERSSGDLAYRLVAESSAQEAA